MLQKTVFGVIKFEQMQNKDEKKKFYLLNKESALISLRDYLSHF